MRTYVIKQQSTASRMSVWAIIRWHKTCTQLANWLQEKQTIIIKKIKLCLINLGVSEQFLNSTSAQLGNTVPFTSVYAGKFEL